MAISIRGVTRRDSGITGTFSIRQTFFGDNIAGQVSLRSYFEFIAHRQYDFSVKECIFGWTAAFDQIWSHVRIRIQLKPDADISAAAISNLKTTWANGIRTTWSNQWGVGQSSEAICPLTFEVQWVTSNAHHIVRVRQGPAGSNMTTWDTQDSGGVAAHEYGHMLGLVDEYYDSDCPDRNPVGTGTVMDNNSTNVPARMMTRFAKNIGSTVVAI